VLGAANPVPDRKHPLTAKEGVKKRFLRDPPAANLKTLRRFSEFVADWIKKNLQPLEPEYDFDFETWLAKTPYPKWRKEQLRRKNAAISNDWDEKFNLVKSFIKDECYPSYKHARGINSRSDEFKCLVGPVFKAIEKAVFKLDYFIKKVPQDQRPDYIFDKLYRPGSRYSATDYTAFESLFVAEMMKVCEFQLYGYMLSKTPQQGDFMRRCFEVLAGTNICEFKWFTARCEATRMSGEMNTSLGNGFSNLMFALFMFEEKGCTNVDGVVEGDDGLFCFEGPAPTCEDFASLGLNIKLEIHEELTSASFCGLIFDLEDRVNVTNPIEAMLDFGWTSDQYAGAGNRIKLSLLKAKSLSMAYAYAGCPILSALARYGNRVTKGSRIGKVIDSGKLSQWERDQLLEAIADKDKLQRLMNRPVPMNTRFLVEREFNIPVEMQVQIEKYLDSLEVLQPLDVPNVDLFVHADAIDFYRKYAVASKTDEPQLEHCSFTQLHQQLSRA